MDDSPPNVVGLDVWRMKRREQGVRVPPSHERLLVAVYDDLFEGKTSLPSFGLTARRIFELSHQTRNDKDPRSIPDIALKIAITVEMERRLLVHMVCELIYGSNAYGDIMPNPASGDALKTFEAKIKEDKDSLRILYPQVGMKTGDRSNDYLRDIQTAAVKFVKNRYPAFTPKPLGLA